uniref:BTB domain-containing protein n=1 Tax=viral metagenome TaxID=1070528 RepID=A0A6C0C614_9ZZZZ
MSIILNVSGKIFRVLREIICKSELFKNLLEDCVIENEIIVDRSSKLFKHVYAYLLDDKYPYPKEYHSELDYYLISYDINLLYDPYGQLSNRLELLEKNVSTLNDKMFVMFDEIQEQTTDIVRELTIFTNNELNLMGSCPFNDCHREYCHYRQACTYHRGECVINGCKNIPDGRFACCRDHLFDR